jgi:broad specificity phosphatase PhoE
MEKDIRPPGTRIFLVRHGETEWNRIHRFQGRSDIPLNLKGRDQARALALALKDEHIAAIYSSPLARSLETARLIQKFHPSSPLFQEERLLEMDLGDFEGMEAQRWIVEYPGFRKTWEKNPASITMPGGESLQEVQARAIEALENIIQHYPPESTLLICSHNFVNIAILCYAMQLSFDRFRECRQETAALNVLYKHGQRFQVAVVNDRSHLKKDNE